MENKRGTAGLTVLLSVIALLFMVGLVVYVFTLFGVAIDETTQENVGGSVANETIANFTDSGTELSVYGTGSLEITNEVVQECYP